MNKKIFFLLLSIIIITLSTLAVYSQMSATPQSQNNGNIQSSNDPSELITYRHVFSHVALLKKEGDELAAKGKDGARIRGLYKHAVPLSDQQADLLEAIALDCQRNVGEQDKKAFKIIEAFRKTIPKLKSSVSVPVVPTELAILQAERDGMILHSRDLLRTAFGDAEFQRFDHFLKTKINLNVGRHSVDDLRRSNTEAQPQQ